MKLNGMAGTGSGKLGSQVYATFAGQQVVRAYQPKVANPNTSAQVDQRGRLKLISQLSAAMSSVIVMPRRKMQSARNQFTKKNIGMVVGAGTSAVAFLENFKLTNGSAAIPRVRVQRIGDNKMTLSMQSSAVGQADRIVYNVFARSEEGEVMLVRSAVQTNAGDNGTFDITLQDYEADLYVYAYGMKDLNKAAKAKYGDYKVESGEDIAKLAMSRVLKSSDYSFTDTTGTAISVDEEASSDVPEGSVKITFAFVGDGAIRNNSASGAVVTSPLIKLRGSRIKWFAVPAPGYEFWYWQIVTDGNKKVTTNPITFTAWADATILVNCSYTGDTGSGGLE